MNEDLRFLKDLERLTKEFPSSSITTEEILSYFHDSNLSKGQLLLICNYLISKGMDVSDYDSLKAEADAESLLQEEESILQDPPHYAGEENEEWTGPWMDLISTAPKLEEEEEKRLLALAAADDEKATETLLSAHTGMVFSLAQAVKLQDERLRQDLFAEGLTALLEAIKSYDPQGFSAFSTYAGRRIRRRIHQFVGENDIVARVSAEMMDKMNRARAAYQKLSRQLEREPTDVEIAEEIGISPERLQELQDALPSGTSLYSDFMEETDFFSDTEGEEDKSEELVLTEQILKAISTLPVLDQECFIACYGLDGSTPKKVGDIALMYGVTEEMAGQCIERALQQMRAAGIDTDFFEY